MGLRLSFSVFVLAIVWVGFAQAQTIRPGDEPGRVETRFKAPPAPRATVAIRQGLEATVPPEQAASIVLKLKGVRFEGNTALHDEALRVLAEDLIGKKVTLQDVFKVAADITTAYGNAGYTLSRAIVPPQELEPGGAVVTFKIIEGYVDQVVWPGELETYRDLFTSYAEKITAERPVRVQTIERYLLLANDLPGLTLSSRLTPSESNPAASTLVVSLEKEKHLSASLGVNNRGSEGSGPYQAESEVVFSNVLGMHEELSLGYTIAGPQHDKTKPELHYLSWGYSQVLSSEGLTFDFSGNASWGDPGTEDLLILDYETESLNLSGSLLYPFIRTRDTNLTGTLGFDWKNSESWMLGAEETEDRLRIVRGELTFDHADTHGGINQIIVSVSHGIDGLGSTENGSPLHSRENGKVDFFKASLQASRLQDLGNQWSVLGLVSGQLSADPLLSSQECGYGGGSIGRSYEPSVISGDHCLLGLAEIRYDANVENLGLKRFQPYAFADYGAIWNKDQPLGTPDQDDAASVGGGVRMSWENFDADFQAAYQVERPESVTVDHRIGFFFDLTARF